MQEVGSPVFNRRLQRTRFKPGNNANPLGAGAHDPALKAFKRLTSEQMLEIFNLIVQGNKAELKAIERDSSAPVVKAMVAAVAMRIIEKGDMHALDVLLNRLIGKVRDTIEMTNEAYPQIILTIPSNGREAISS